jgi:hypothetical protein
MKPITVNVNAIGLTEVLHCKHENQWPPRQLALGLSIEELRSKGVIDTQPYEQLKTWERVCGLHEMSPTKCPKCPFVLR